MELVGNQRDFIALKKNLLFLFFAGILRPMFISDPIDGHVYIAERPRYRSMACFNGLIWSIIPVAPTAGFKRIDASKVPYLVRRKAYHLFEKDR
jgi:hypothetical protein